MSVAKPWMEPLPEPLMSHSLAGLPALVFSHATGLVTGASHGAAVAGEAPAIRPRTSATSPESAMRRIRAAGTATGRNYASARPASLVYRGVFSRSLVWRGAVRTRRPRP